MDALELGVFEIGPCWRLISEPMRQIIKLQPPFVVGVCLKFDAADFDHLSFLLGPASLFAPCTALWYTVYRISVGFARCPAVVCIWRRRRIGAVQNWDQRFCEMIRPSRTPFVSSNRRAIVLYSALNR